MSPNEPHAHVAEPDDDTTVVLSNYQQTFRWLLAQGVAVAKVPFDGSGDSGTMLRDELALYSRTGNTIELDIAPIEECLNDLCYDAAGDQYDWVNNDGGFGAVWLVVVDYADLRPEPLPPMSSNGTTYTYHPSNPLHELFDLLDADTKGGSIVVDMNVREMTSENHVYTYADGSEEDA